MKLQHMKSQASIVSLLILFVCSSFATSNAPFPPASVVVIVNANNPIEKMPASVVRIFWLRAGKKKWPTSNKGIKPVDRKVKCAEKDAFLSQVVQMSSDNVEKYFAAKQYQYAETPPDKFAADSEVIDFIGREEGAIGYINKSSLTADNASKVKVVFEF
jgi:ABC-type phosphate transport system substrate-binding protein